MFARKKFAARVRDFETTLFTMFTDGRKYAEWRGVRANEAEVIAFLEFSAHYGDPIAVCCLGQFYLAGEIVALDLDRAEAYLTLAYQHGDLPALSRLGNVALASQCAQHRLDELTALFDAEQPKANSFREVLRRQREGKDYFQVFHGIVYRQAMAGDMDAQNSLVLDWLVTSESRSRLANTNVAEAARFLAESAAKQGSKEAQWRLVELLTVEKLSMSARQAWILGGSRQISDMASVASEQSLVWAVLASRNKSSESPSVSSLAHAYIKLAAEHHGHEILQRASQAADSVVILETWMTVCTRSTKSLLAAHAGIFPENWKAVVKPPVNAPRIIS